MSKIRIEKNYKKISELLNKNIDLEYDLLLKKAIRFWFKDVNIGSKKNPNIVTSKIMVYKDVFMDEDTKEKIIIERNRYIEVNGVRCDEFLNPLVYYKPEDIKA